MNYEQTIDQLNSILQYLNDSLNGYELNQDDISDTRLKPTLERLCLERRTMIDELKDKIVELGGQPKDRKTIAGTLHQWYQDIKNAITGGDPLAISKQIRFGESFLIDEYKKALKENLPADVRQLLINQISSIEDGLREIEIETTKA